VTAPLVPFRSRGRGRQPAIVEAIRDERDELRVVAEEALDFAVTAVHLIRRLQTALSERRFGLAAEYSVDIESLGTRAANRAKAAAAIAKVRQAEANGTCPDHTLVAAPAHGRAA
jgi:hypothetical protein